VISTTVIRPCTEKPASVGKLLRHWRERRRLTQLDLALRAEVSARHLSFIETGRSRPTSEMILRLAQHLDVPLRERNMLLLSGGYAPAYPANGLADQPMSAVHEAIEHVLRAHEPFPAVVIDARWELVAGNDAVPVLTEGAAPALLEPPLTRRSSRYATSWPPTRVLGPRLLRTAWRSWSPCGSASTAPCCHCSAPRPCSARPGTSPCPNWPSSHFIRPTR
jgi:transcriptional regulator with XRE-family HTH domain